ncbi:chitinase-like protein [Thalictrum thalictroides]|uniref:Chitinase-like protein n=1 Tax=Thalictrum thalictroides TaxID=46969 RepID=A0A7J6WTR7_THATH|nr:chitinase-like protein [Thalictrum thalictroides]
MQFSALSANSSFLTSNSSIKFLLFYSNGRKIPNREWDSNGLIKFPTLNKNSCSSSGIRSSRLRIICFNGITESKNRGSLEIDTEVEGCDGELKVEVGNPKFLNLIPVVKLSMADQAFFLLAFIACTTSIAFTSLVAAAVPTLYAMARAATSLSKLADTAREELPSTMAAIRLSGMEISDLTLELSDLSQEIADGVNKSTQAVQAAEAGIRQIGALARQQTISMIQERANLPVISLQPAVVGAAKKTSQAVGRATKSFMGFISRGELSSGDEDNDVDKVEV